MKEQVIKLCALILIPLMSLLNCPAIGFADQLQKANTAIKHKHAGKVKAGTRISLKANVSDDSGVKSVRAYFKATGATDYSFVKMQAVDGNTYVGTLPAPASSSAGLDYLILVENGDSLIIKTQTYAVSVGENPNAATAVAGNAKLKVYTELAEQPDELVGFADKISIDTVPPAEKLGVIAGLYSASSAGHSTSTARDAGAVEASAGISTTAIVIGAVAAAAAIGVAAGGSGGGSDGGDPLTSQNLVGNWGIKETSGGSTYN